MPGFLVDGHIICSMYGGQEGSPLTVALVYNFLVLMARASSQVPQYQHRHCRGVP